MNKTKLAAMAIYSILLLLVAFLSSCATSKLTATWQAPDLDDRAFLQNVLVIAVTQEETIKRLLEDRYVAELHNAGVRAVPSYTLSTPDIKPDMKALDAAIAEAEAESVIITHYLGKETTERYRPPQLVSVMPSPYYARMYGYYPMVYRDVFTPGYSYSVTTISLESTLYDSETGKLVWTARAETVNESLDPDKIAEVVELFLADLREKGFLF